MSTPRFWQLGKCVFWLALLCCVLLVSLGFARAYSRFAALSRIAKHSESTSIQNKVTGPLCQFWASSFRLPSAVPDFFYFCLFPIRTFSINEVDDAALAELSYFPEIEHLSLSDCKFDDAAMSSLRSLPNLKTIEIDFAEHVNDRGLYELEACPKLERINLMLIGKSNGSFLTKLRCHDTLEVVELVAGMDLDIPFNDDSLLWLEPFKKLRQVKIEYGFFEGYGFEVFSKLPKLESVRIDVPNEEARMWLKHIPEVDAIK